MAIDPTGFQNRMAGPAFNRTKTEVQEMSTKANSESSLLPSDQKILLVDDDASIRELVGRVLANKGYQVITAASGLEALEIAVTTPLDLVLLDLNMPDQNGWDTFCSLTLKDPTMAVIIITAQPGQLFTSLGAGVGALLEKPLDFPTLLDTVVSLLAESAELRLARLTGRRAEFYFRPSGGKVQRLGRG